MNRDISKKNRITWTIVQISKPSKIMNAAIKKESGKLTLLQNLNTPNPVWATIYSRQGDHQKHLFFAIFFPAVFWYPSALSASATMLLSQ